MAEFQLIYVGIDPGLHGAVAVINSKRKIIGIWDTPILEVVKKTAHRKGKKAGKVSVSKKGQYLPAQMAKILQDLPKERVAVVGLEQVHSMPQQSAQSVFRLGEGYGLWIGIIGTLGLPIEMVPPQSWKKVMLAVGSGADKGLSIARAQSLIPESSQWIKLAKHDGRAEALLMAEYFRRKRKAGL